MSKAKAPFRLRIVSDTHCGNHLGLWPPDFEYEGEMYAQNKVNRWLWECWRHMIDQYPAPDLLIHAGDIVDGMAPKDRGVGVKTADPEVQQAAAIEVMRPLVQQCPQWYMVKGTQYHERYWLGIVNELKAIKFPDGSRSGPVLDLRIRDRVVNIAHHPDAGGVIYRATAMEKTLVASMLASAMNEVPQADVIVRAHTHFPGIVQMYGRTAIFTPCWQLQTRYAVKKAFYRMRPKIGFIDVIFGDEEYPEVRQVIYPIPVTKVVDIA